MSGRQSAAAKAAEAEAAALEALSELEPEELAALEELAASGIDLSALVELAAGADPKPEGDGEPPAPGTDAPPLEEEPPAPAVLRTYRALYPVVIGREVVPRGGLFQATPDHPRVKAGQAAEVRETPAPEVAAALAEASGEAPTG